MSYYCYMNAGYNRPYQGLPQKAKVQQQQNILRYVEPVSGWVSYYRIENNTKRAVGIVVDIGGTTQVRTIDSGWVLPIFAAPDIPVRVTITQKKHGGEYLWKLELKAKYSTGFYTVSDIQERYPRTFVRLP